MSNTEEQLKEIKFCLELAKSDVEFYISPSNHRVWKINKALKSLQNISKMVELYEQALTCNETYHRLGGIDDCEPCKAKKKAREIMGGNK